MIVVLLSAYILLIPQQHVLYFQPRIMHPWDNHKPVLNNALKTNETTHFDVDFLTETHFLINSMH